MRRTEPRNAVSSEGNIAILHRKSQTPQAILVSGPLYGGDTAIHAGAQSRRLDQQRRPPPRKRSITDDPATFTGPIEMLTTADDCAEAPITVAIEAPRGLWAALPRATRRPVYAINPLAVARDRERHSVARAKPDHADAMTLGNILRPTLTRNARCRPTAGCARRSRYWRDLQLNLFSFRIRLNEDIG